MHAHTHAPEDVDGHVEAAGGEKRLHHPRQPRAVHHAALLFGNGGVTVRHRRPALFIDLKKNKHRPPRHATARHGPLTWLRWLYQ